MYITVEMGEMEQHPEHILSLLSRMYGENNRAYAFSGSTPEDVASWQEKARPELHRLLGLPVIEQSAAGFQLKADMEQVKTDEPFLRFNGTLYTEPDMPVPFIMLRPEGDGPFPLGLFPHGHGNYGMRPYTGLYDDEAGKLKIENEDRDVAVQAVRKGYVAVATTTRGFKPAVVADLGDRHGGRGCRSQLMHALLAGRTATGERVWDQMKFIDWAGTLGYVDTSRILIMGNSGGGVVTYYTAAADTRVSVAVPSCSFCTYAGKDGRIHSCDCNMIPGIYRFGESSDVAGLTAPRHLCIVNGSKDTLFPLDEIDRAVAGVRRIYEAAGCPEHFRHGYGSEGHRFYKDISWPFIDRIINNE